MEQTRIELNIEENCGMAEDPIKDVLKMMPYGFYSVTSRNGDEVNAMVANWISQVSFEPRLVMLALQKSSYTRGVIEEGRVFAINLFRAEDEAAMTPFCKGRAKFPEKMRQAQYEAAPVTGCPILADAAAYIELEITRIVETGGDHDLIVGTPVGAGVLKPAEAAEILTLPGIGWSYAG